MTEYKLVPVEPTDAMRHAFHESYERYEDGHGECPDSQWQAMLAAAPVAENPKLVVRGHTEEEILMCQLVLLELAAADLDDLDTGVIEIIGEDSHGREGSAEVNLQEYAGKAAEILGSIVAAPDAQPLRHTKDGALAECPYCDDTGEVHSIDGEWRGACGCRQQTGTDALVEKWVETLERYIKKMEALPRRSGHAFESTEKKHAKNMVIRAARAFVSTYRKQGGE